jgi:phosphotriesterase-related protein
VSVVRTVRGDIEPSEMGPTDSHEHLFFVTPPQPGDECADVDRAIAEAQTLVDAGARTMVDGPRSTSDAILKGCCGCLRQLGYR